ncbi:MAG: hypothetical protein JEZ11_13405 [Desulfobacterales bacterium]|nr:hypothetical protein [Desulfobacterales bacterium]
MTTAIRVLIVLLLNAVPATATQTHGEPEGLYVHQMAHFFFIVSMGILEFWLRQRNLVRKPGWRYIQMAAVLLILWNLDAMFVHFLAEQVDFIKITPIDLWHIKISTPENQKFIAILYYAAKLDHLLCVPAMCCMYHGLQTLLKDTAAAESPTHRP